MLFLEKEDFLVLKEDSIYQFVLKIIIGYVVCSQQLLLLIKMIKKFKNKKIMVRDFEID